MTAKRTSITMVMADDDQEDCMMTRDALAESRVVNNLHFVHDGEELMDYLLCRGPYAALGAAPRPGLILLDLNMPRKDGREALREIKADAELRDIPVVVLTTSKSEEDIARSYTIGASSFITKPVTFGGLVEVMKTLGQYWFDIVDLPMRP